MVTSSPSFAGYGMWCWSIYKSSTYRGGWSNVSGVEGYRYQQDFPYADFSYDRLPFDDESFDCITAWEVFEHLENPYHAMREAKRLLREKGTFLFSVPNPCHIESRLLLVSQGSLARWSETNDHIGILTEEIVKKTFGKEMKILEISYAVPTLFSRRGRIIGKINRSMPRNRLFGLFTLYALRK